jgi:glycosyltransferase involved in cell wall biosynthesis
MARVSLIIPARNEQFLVPTVNDVLAHATGDIEIIVVLEGYWPVNPPLPDDARIKIIHHGKAKGMRPAINAATKMATGDYFMKLDAHCLVSQGFDDVLKADCDDNWIVVPRRYSLDPDNWRVEPSKPAIDAHYLSYPFEKPPEAGGGLHGTIWLSRGRERRQHLIDDEMSSQGSCWFMSRKHWARLGDMEIAKYGNFIQEFQELGLKTWLGGGAVKINKKCHYAHLHKGKRFGRGYWISKGELAEGAAFAIRYWMLDQWPERQRDLRWLIEKFAPVPTWPADLDEAFRHAREVLQAS